LTGYVKRSLGFFSDVLARVLLGLVVLFLRACAVPVRRLLKKPSKKRSTSSRFDSIFLEEGRGVPVPFLRALARRESNMNPKEQKGPAWGLMQVGISPAAGDVLKSYNKRRGTSYTPQDMLNPILNVRVASDLLARIVRLYEALGLVQDWENANYVGLVVAGWNSGYSQKAGTARAIKAIKARGESLTLDAVYREAERDPEITRHLRNPKKQKWQRSVVASFFDEADVPPVMEEMKWLPLVLMLLALSSR